MRRVAQLATLLLFAAILLTPIAEYFDRWDSAGLSEDTEFAVFAFIFTLTFVLVVCVLLAQFALCFASFLALPFQAPSDDILATVTSLRPVWAEPPISVPLRI